MSALSPRLLRALLGLHLLSALLFIAVVAEPKFDEKNMLRDAARYTREGVTLDALRDHVNAPGPGSYLWLCLPTWLLGARLWAYRLGAWASWLVLGAWLLRPREPSADELPGAPILLAALVFPHSAVCTALMLTEGPALLAAVVGATLWIRGTFGEGDRGRAPRQLGGAVVIGLAIICRQYYLALVPAMAVTLWLHRRRAQRRALAVASVLLGLLPLALLALVWGGLASPRIASGQSYSRSSASVGLNLARPLLALGYTAVYLVPFTFPIVLSVRGAARRVSLGAALLAVLAAAIWLRVDLLQWGPVNTVVGGLERRVAGLGRALLLGLVFASSYGLCACALAWDRWGTRAAGLTFSIAVLPFFVAEQVGVSGHQFFDRYVLQVAPFIGVIGAAAGAACGRWRTAQAAVLLGLFGVSQLMLWRYAF